MGKISRKPISVNWHFWPWCNMNCLFCFATFKNQKEVMPKIKALEVPKLLKEAGTEKISFVGGEPMLCPYLDELIKGSYIQGLANKIVSNGTGFSEKFLEKNHKYINIVGLSLDSASSDINKQLGRGKGKHLDKIKSTVKLLQKYDIQFHLNTTVTKLTWQEDMRDLVKELNPIRWKVFQVLKVKGENDSRVEPILISNEEYEKFKEIHKDLPQAIFEDNELMYGSYVMLDPIGRFFHNTSGFIQYSKSIFEIGVEDAFEQIQWDTKKFVERKGIYNWHNKKEINK